MEKVNQAEAYDVEVVPIVGLQPGDKYWRVAKVYHVSDDKNDMQFHAFVNVFDENGGELRGNRDIKIVWGWENQKPSEPSPAVYLEKQRPENMTNIPLFFGLHVWVSVASSSNYPSEVVKNLHTAHADEGDGNRFGHHSFIIDFELAIWKGSADNNVGTPPVVDGNGPFAVLKAELVAIVNRLNKIVEGL